MDRRDEITWIALELSRAGEIKVEDGVLEETLRADLDVDEHFPIFIPAVTYIKGRRKFTVQLMEGYAFVSSGLPETSYFELEKKPYINQVMSSKMGPYQMRVLSTIPNKKIKELRSQFRELVSADIEINDKVRVLEGPYKMMEGVVLGKKDDDAFVKFELRSLKTIATIPLVFLETDDNNE